MKREMITETPLKQFDYMRLPNGYVDVFIYQFIEKIVGENGDISFRYLMNEFRTNKVSKEEIESDPIKYMDYDEKEERLEDVIKKMQSKIDELTFTIAHISDNVQEIAKKDNTELPAGDYLNPIFIPEDGINMIKGLFYFVDDKTLPHESLRDMFVKQENFNDRTLFDYI